jgi:hypothetical protein
MSFNDEEKIMFLFSNENMIRICAKTCLQILKRKDIEIVYTVNCFSFLIYVHQL